VNPTSKILSQLPRTNLDRIIKAILFAFDAHKSQKRKVGESYIVHPLRVALQALVMGGSVETIIAAALHDVIEDTSVTISEIRAKFGEQSGNYRDSTDETTKRYTK
jgi:GTP pyrophosphokinase